MSSAEPYTTDAKNSIKNLSKYHHSEVRRIQVSEKMDPSQTQDDRNKKHFSRVMCFGTFDNFHPGHVYYLSEARRLADHMTVVIARDHRVFTGKGRDPVHDEQMRLQGVKKAFPEATVILGHESDIFAPIREFAPDVLCFGYDQRAPEERIKELFPDIEIMRISGFETDKWKSSLLRAEQAKPKNKD